MNQNNPLLGLGADDAFTVTSTGKRLYYAQFNPGDIVFNDIATHLAHTCRWLGALRCHYSTAEHSVLMARYALTCPVGQLPKALQFDDATAQKVAREGFAKACLFHDAEEFITGDFPSPLKQFFNPLFEQYASYVREIIYEKYNVHYAWYPHVKDWDRRILFTEATRHLQGGAQIITEPGCVAPPTLDVAIYAWIPDVAAKHFKEIYLRLI